MYSDGKRLHHYVFCFIKAPSVMVLRKHSFKIPGHVESLDRQNDSMLYKNLMLFIICHFIVLILLLMVFGILYICFYSELIR